MAACRLGENRNSDANPTVNVPLPLGPSPLTWTLEPVLYTCHSLARQVMAPTAQVLFRVRSTRCILGASQELTTPGLLSWLLPLHVSPDTFRCRGPSPLGLTARQLGLSYHTNAALFLQPCSRGQGGEKHWGFSPLSSSFLQIKKTDSLTHCWWEHKMAQPPWKPVYFLKKQNTLTIRPSNHTPGRLSQEGICVHTKTCTQLIEGALLSQPQSGLVVGETGWPVHTVGPRLNSGTMDTCHPELQTEGKHQPQKAV